MMILNSERDVEAVREIMENRILLMVKRDNVAFEWSVPEDVPALRIVVFDPDDLEDHSE